MGFVLNVDLETSEGPTHELYLRIESLSFNKVTSQVGFQITYWQNRARAIRFNRTYLHEERKNASGLVQERILYFPDAESDGVEILLPHFLRVYTVSEQEVEIPVYETRIVKKEVPYVSFDENGDEITLYREVSSEKQVQVGTKLQIEEVINGGILDNIFGFCYDKLHEELAKYIPADKIEIV